MRPNQHSVLLDLHQDAKIQDALPDPTIFYTLDSASEIRSRKIRIHKQTSRETQHIIQYGPHNARGQLQEID